MLKAGVMLSKFFFSLFDVVIYQHLQTQITHSSLFTNMHIHYIQKMHSVLYKMVDISKLNMHNIVFENDGWWTSKNNLHTLTRYNLKTEKRNNVSITWAAKVQTQFTVKEVLKVTCRGGEGARRNITTKFKSQLSVHLPQ